MLQDISAIERAILDSSTAESLEVINKFRCDPENLPLAQSMLESEGNPTKSEIFLSSCIRDFVEKQIYQFEDDFCLSLLDWITSFLFSRYSSIHCSVISNLSSSYGTIFSNKWPSSANFQENLTHLVFSSGQDNRSIAISIMIETVDSMHREPMSRLAAKQKFSNLFLPMFFEYSCNLIRQIADQSAQEEPILSTALDLIDKCLTFTSQNGAPTDDVKGFSISTPPMMREYISDTDNILLCISAYKRSNGFRPIRCLFDVVSMSNSSFLEETQKEVIISVIYAINAFFATFSDHFDYTTALWLSMLLSKIGIQLSIVITQNSVVPEFFLSALKFSMTVLNCDRTFSEVRDVVVNTMSFWTSVVGTFASFGDVVAKPEALRIASETITPYHSFLVRSIQSKDKEAQKILESDHYVASFLQLAYSDPQQILTLISGRVELTNSLEFALNVSILKALLPIRPRNSLDSRVISVLREVYITLYSITESICNSSENVFFSFEIERVLIRIFLKSHTIVAASVQCLRDNEAIEPKYCFENWLSICYSKIISDMKSPAISEDLVLLAISALESLGFVTQFLGFFKEADFPFLSNCEFVKARIAYYTFLAEIFHSDHSQSNLHFLTLEIDFEARPIDAFNSVRGIFLASKSCTEYLHVIDWFIINEWPNVHMNSESFGNIKLALSALKMWNAIVKPNSEWKISFPKTSPLGILLFKATVDFLKPILHVINQNSVERSYRPCILAFRIISTLLSCDYILFGAFELYNDPTLRNFFSFISPVLRNICGSECMRQKKGIMTILSLSRSLTSCQSHLKVEMEVDPSIVQSTIQFAILAIDYGLDEIDDNINSIIESLDQFLGSSQNEELRSLLTELALQFCIGTICGTKSAIRNSASIFQVALRDGSFFEELENRLKLRCSSISSHQLCEIVSKYEEECAALAQSIDQSKFIQFVEALQSIVREKAPQIMSKKLF